MADFANATIEWGTTPDTITLLQLMKDQMGITDNSRDTELSMYLDVAGTAAESYIDNIIDQRDVKENLPMKQAPITLRYYPVTALIGVTIDGEDMTADYTLYHAEGLNWAVMNTCGSTHGDCFEQMILTYTAGYDPLPAELGFAIVAGAMSYESSNAAASGNIRKETVVGVGSIEYDTSGGTTTDIRAGALPPITVGTLDAYKRAWA